jgi:hypothetical protein
MDLKDYEQLKGDIMSVKVYYAPNSNSPGEAHESLVRILKFVEKFLDEND